MSSNLGISLSILKCIQHMRLLYVANYTGNNNLRISAIICHLRKWVCHINSHYKQYTTSLIYSGKPLALGGFS